MRRSNKNAEIPETPFPMDEEATKRCLTWVNGRLTYYVNRRTLPHLLWDFWSCYPRTSQPVDIDFDTDLYPALTTSENAVEYSEITVIADSEALERDRTYPERYGSTRLLRHAKRVQGGLLGDPASRPQRALPLDQNGRRLRMRPRRSAAEREIRAGHAVCAGLKACLTMACPRLLRARPPNWDPRRDARGRSRRGSRGRRLRGCRQSSSASPAAAGYPSRRPP